MFQLLRKYNKIKPEKCVWSIYNFPFFVYLATTTTNTEQCSYTQEYVIPLKISKKKTSCTCFYYYLFKFFFVNTRVRKTFVIIFGWLFINLYFLAYSYVRVDSFMLVCTTLYSWTEKNVYVSYVFENIVVTLCNIPIWQVIGLILLKRARDNLLKKKKRVLTDT